MAVSNIFWNGDFAFVNTYKIVNTGGGVARIKKIYLINRNEHILGGDNNNSSYYNFFEKKFPFKFFRPPSKTPGVSNGYLQSYISWDIEQPQYNFVSPFFRYEIQGNEIKYMTGQDLVRTNELDDSEYKLYGKSLLALYRAPNTFDLPAFSLANDFIQLTIMFNGDTGLDGDYYADLHIEYLDVDNINVNFVTTIKATVNNSNIVEMDFISKDDIESVIGYEIFGNAITIG